MNFESFVDSLGQLSMSGVPFLLKKSKFSFPRIGFTKKLDVPLKNRDIREIGSQNQYQVVLGLCVVSIVVLIEQFVYKKCSLA